MSTPDTATRVWHGLLALVLEENDRRKEVSEALDLSFIRIKALRRLAAAPLSMRELAESLSTDAPYATLVVDELERRALAERRAHPSDRRSKLVALTAAGVEAARKADRILGEPPASLRALDAEDLTTLDRIVTILLSA